MNFCIEDQFASVWRTWKYQEDWGNKSREKSWKKFKEELMERRIMRNKGEDRLRRGHKPIGMLTVEEAYKLSAGQHLLERDNIWSLVWDNFIWPKVKKCLWLIIYREILTWDCIKHKGFQGPFVLSADPKRKLWITC